MRFCLDCGKTEQEAQMHSHHVFGRKADPDTVVDLCKFCHERRHSFMFVFYDNKASRKFKKWLASEERKRFVPRGEMIAKLDKLGYLPMHDK